MLTPYDCWNIALLALCIWREARGEILAAKKGVAWSVKNRVDHPSWWGDSYHTVILKPKQYSSFNPGDVNAVKFPDEHDTAWQACLQIALSVYTGESTDNTDGADHYYDTSIPAPSWTAPPVVHKVDIGRLKFFKTV
jgi:N-acetylmuramoyl-L-alanine amidase